MTHSSLFLGRLGIWREKEKREVFGTFCHSFPKTERNSFKCYKLPGWKSDFRLQDYLDLFSQTWKVALGGLRDVQTVVLFLCEMLWDLWFQATGANEVLAKLRWRSKFSIRFLNGSEQFYLQGYYPPFRFIIWCENSTEGVASFIKLTAYLE